MLSTVVNVCVISGISKSVRGALKSCHAKFRDGVCLISGVFILH